MAKYMIFASVKSILIYICWVQMIQNGTYIAAYSGIKSRGDKVSMKENVKTWHLWIVGKATPDWRALPCSCKSSPSLLGLFSRDFLNLFHITPIHDGFLEFLHWSVECQCLCTPWHNNSLKVRWSMGDCLATNFSAVCQFLVCPSFSCQKQSWGQI